MVNEDQAKVAAITAALAGRVQAVVPHRLKAGDIFRHLYAVPVLGDPFAEDALDSGVRCTDLRAHKSGCVTGVVWFDGKPIALRIEDDDPRVDKGP